MAAREKVFTLKIDGIQKAVNSVEDLESSIDDLESRLRKAKFGSAEFKALQSEFKAAQKSYKDFEKTLEVAPLIDRIEKNVQAVQGLGDAFVNAGEAVQLFTGENEQLAKAIGGLQATMGIIASLQAMVGAIKAASEASGILARAVNFLGGPVGALITIIAGVGAALLAFTLNTDKAAAAQKEFDKAMAGATAEAEKETVILEQLFANLKSTTAGTNDRRNAVASLNEQYGEYLPALNLENATLAQIEDVQRRVTEEVVKAAKARALATQAEQVWQKVAEKALRLEEVRMRLSALGVRNAADFNRELEGGIDIIDAASATLSRFTGINATTRGEIVELIREFGSLTQDVNAAEEQMRRLTQASLGFSNTAAPQVVAGAEAVARALGEIATLDPNEALKAQLALLEALREQSERVLQSVDEAANGFSAGYRSTLDHNVDLTQQAADKQVELTRQMHDELLAEDKDYRNRLEEQAAATAQAQRERFAADLSAVTDYASQVASAAGELFGNLLAAQQQQVDSQLQTTADRLGELQGQIEETQARLSDLTARLASDDAANREETIRQINAQRAAEQGLLAQERAQQAQQAELEAQQKVLQQKQARNEKALRMFQIGLATAQAVTAALANPPGPPYSIPQAIAAGALGGIQLAAAAATPVPQFYEGGFTGGKNPRRAAGIVHEMEYVVPHSVSRRPDVQPVLQRLEAMRVRGYQAGGPVTATADMSGVADTLAPTLDAAMKLADRPVYVSVQQFERVQGRKAKAVERGRLA